MKWILLERWIKKFPDYTDSERTTVREKHKIFEQNLEIKRNKKWEKFLKREQTQELVEIINLEVLLSNLKTTAVNITSNVEQPPGEKRIEAEKRDSNRKSYVQVLMNTSTVTEQIPDTNSRFSLLAIDDKNVTDNRSQRKRKKLAESSIVKTLVGKNASVDF